MHTCVSKFAGVCVCICVRTPLIHSLLVSNATQLMGIAILVLEGMDAHTNREVCKTCPLISICSCCHQKGLSLLA